MLAIIWALVLHPRDSPPHLVANFHAVVGEEDLVLVQILAPPYLEFKGNKLLLSVGGNPTTSPPKMPPRWLRVEYNYLKPPSKPLAAKATRILLKIRAFSYTPQSHKIAMIMTPTTTAHDFQITCHSKILHRTPR